MQRQGACTAIIVGVAANMALAIKASGAPADGEWARRPFSAELVRYSTSEPSRREHSRVYMAPMGLREEAGLAQGKPPRLVMISHRESGKAWMLAPRRGVALALPEGRADEDERALSGVFSPAPCAGFTQRDEYGSLAYAGRTVIKWRCREPGSGDERWQFYDPDLGVVVREERWNGRVEELRRIRPGPQPQALFTVPPGFRFVSMKEFFTGVPEFPRYRETGEEGNVPVEEEPELNRYRSGVGVPQNKK